MTAAARPPIQVCLPGSPPRTCDTWAQVVGYALGCWLRRRWPFDRRSEGGAGWGGRERRAS